MRSQSVNQVEKTSTPIHQFQKTDLIQCIHKFKIFKYFK